jgi:hypothetical protein
VAFAEEEDGVGNVMESIEHLLPDLQTAQVTLAFEFEPSILCALGERSSLLSFCQKLEQREQKDSAWAQVGLNFDLAHWAFLSDFTPATFPLELRRWIRHAHISSHSRGHFSDAPLERSGGNDLLRRESQFMRWLEFLEEVNELSSFSGHVSLELECCRVTHSVAASLQNLRQWLGESR